MALTEKEIKHPKNAIEKLAARLDLSKDVLMDCLQKTAFSLCKEPAQFVAACVVANTYGLNPILKEMYAFPGKSGGVVPVVSIDGWIKLVNRQENYNGVELIENKTVDGIPNKSGTPVDSVTAKFYIKGREHAVVVTEYMDECFDNTKGPWQKWPRRMLRHKAYIQGARIAFGFGGIYDEDEASRIQETEITAPLIALKNDGKGKMATPPTIDVQASIQPQGPASETTSIKENLDLVQWYEIGDTSRFGSKEEKNAKFTATQLEKVALKLGKEEFMRILGVTGFENLGQICVMKDLVALTNLALTELSAKEENAA